MPDNIGASNPYANLVAFDNGPQLDAFGRLRVSDITPIFDSKLLADSQSIYWNDIQQSGAGTNSVYAAGTSSVTLSVSAAIAGVRTRQTYMRFPYRSGQSQQIWMSAVLAASGMGAGITTRVGYFDDSDGLFFQVENGTLGVVRRSSTSGVAVDEISPQSSWNLDKLDGSGPSALVLDPTLANLYVVDYQWLGSGRVRFGVNVGGVTIYCHEIDNANSRSVVYMKTPNLPLRYQISNSGTGGSGTIVAICSTVLREGAATPDHGLARWASTGGLFVNANVAGTVYAVCGVRLKANTNVAQALTQVSILSNVDFEWFTCLNPTINGAGPVFTDVADSSIQFATGDVVGDPSVNTVAAVGTQLDGGYVRAAGGTGSILTPINNTRRLGTTIVGGVRDQIWLCVRPLAANADVYGGISWRDYL